MSNKFTLIYYYVAEDKDDPEYPNAFGINLSQEDIKVKDIKTAFPLEGEYHFRFKYKVSNQVVWMDLPSENSGLPLFNGKIFMKATRYSWESNSTTTPSPLISFPIEAKQNQEKYYDDIDRQKAAKVSEETKRETLKGVETKSKQPTQQPASYSNSEFDLFDSGNSTQAKVKTNGNTRPQTSLLEDDFVENTSQRFEEAKPKKASNNLMDFDLV